MSDYEPLIVVLSCRWATAQPAPDAGTGSPNVKRIPVLCAGNVHPNTVVEVLNTGADGVLLAACAHAGCHYPEGDAKARSRAEAISLLLEDFGLETERFRFEVLTDFAGQLDSALAEMAETLRALGPNPYA
ncbi:MAG: hydrogenase iron-sulfur subunit [Pseudomonadota bacterium]